jgi:hypothetical protein
MSTAMEKPGADMMHEVTEGYIRGALSQITGNPAPAATLPHDFNYLTSHAMATPQSGNVHRAFYNSAGNLTNNESQAQTTMYYVTPQTGNPVTIMMYP